jgi:glycerol-3-phosphate acyltransferase PlsX
VTIRIALDAMGGDHGTKSVLGGLSLCNFRSSEVAFNVFGDSELINGMCGKDWPYNIVHTDKVIPSDMKPSYALRYGRGSSMFEAISSVAREESDAVVSSGNTGAYMALSKAILKTIPGIERPALVSLIPNIDGGSNVVLDLGANTECGSNNLFQFAIMGDAVAKALLGIENPRVALLNVGAEKNKGTSVVQDAFKLSSDYFKEKFIGFVEGTDLLKSTADVIVTDGFSGNIALKTIEGTFRFVAGLYKKEVQKNIWGKLSYIVSKPVLTRMWEAIDLKKHNGAILVGLNGLAIKSHGMADELSFASAISVAIQLVKSNFTQNIKDFLEHKK